MDKSWIFRTSNGSLGLVRQQNDLVSFYLKSKKSMLEHTGVWLWSEWVHSVSMGYASGDTCSIGIDSVTYYLCYFNIYEGTLINFEEVKFPGYYYRRIANERLKFAYTSDTFFQDIRAYKNIQDSLNILFDYVEPAEVNFLAYGHKIRELLILACTEVEYLLLKVLNENGYPQKSMYKTSDYVKCTDVLQLDKYEVVLSQYPNLKKFKPFFNWDKKNPTKSIPWYSAYNSVKHNRGDNIKEANLENLLDAISAIHILIVSQYGLHVFDGIQSQTDDKSIFQTIKSPDWTLDKITAPFLVGTDYLNPEVRWVGYREFFKDFPQYL